MAYDGSLIFDTSIDTNGFEQSVGNIAASATKAATVVVTAFTTITTVAAKASFKIGMAYESAFAGVEKTVNETVSITYADINEELRDMAKNTMPAAATSIAAVAEAAGQLGIATGNITEFSEVMINLGEATNLTSDMAASQLAKFANITQMDASKYKNLGSTIVALGNNFATTEADIVNMSMRLASAATTAGMAETDILGFSTAMSSVGIEAEAGGSAMSTFIKKMQTAVETGEGLEDFAKIAGMTTDAFKQLWNTDAASAVTAFIGNLNNVEEHGRSAVQILDEMGMTEVRLSNTLLSLASSGDLMTRAISLSNTAWDENTALMNEVEKRYATTESIMNMTKNNISDVGITIYDKFQQPLVTAFETATEKIQIFNDRIAEGDLSDKFDRMAVAFEKVSVAVIEFVADDVLPAAVDGLAWIADNGDTIISEIAGATAAVLAFKVATEGAAVAQAVINTAMKANPYILIGSAIAGLVTSIVTLAIEEKKHYEIMSQGTGKYDEQTKAVQKLADAYTEAQNSANEIVEARDDEIAKLSALKNLLDENIDANGNIISDYETVKALVEEINEIYPEEITLLSDKIEKYNELSGSIESYIQKLRDEAVYESKSEVFKQAAVTYEKASSQNDELYDKWQEAITAAEDAEKKYEWFKSGINRYSGSDAKAAEEAGKSVREYLADLYYTTQGDLDDAKLAYEENLALMEQAKADMDDFEQYLSAKSPETINAPSDGVAIAAKGYSEQLAEKYKNAAENLKKQQEENTQKLKEAWEDAEYEYDIGSVGSEKELYAKKMEIWKQYGDSSLKEHRDYYVDLCQYDKDFAQQSADAEEQAVREKWDNIARLNEMGLITDEEAMKRRKQFIADYYPEYSAEAHEYYKVIYDEENEIAEKSLAEQEKIVEDGLYDIIESHKKAYEELERQRKAYRDKLLSVGGSLFSVDVTEDGKETTTYTVNNLNEQIRKMEEYHRNVKALKERGASESLLSELTSLNDEDSAVFASQLAGMSSADFAKINEYYSEKQRIADELSKDLYKNEAQSIYDSTTAALAELASVSYDYGAQSAQRFTAGFNTTMSELGVASLYDQQYASGANRTYQSYVTTSESGDANFRISVDVTGKSNVYLDGRVVGEAVTDYQGQEQYRKGG